MDGTERGPDVTMDGKTIRPTGRLSARALLLAGLLAAFAWPGAAAAAEVRSGDTITVPAGETIDDDLVATGQTVTIAGRVTGDVYALAQTVVVTGTIDGDLIAAAQQVTLDGSVQSDLRAAAQRITVNGQVGKNVTVGAQRMGVNSGGRIGGSALAGAETVSTFGQLDRGLAVGAGTLQIGGPIGGRVQAAVERLTIEPGARIAGGLDYRASREALVPPGAVAGPVTFTRAERNDNDEDDEAAGQPSILNGLLDLGGLIGLAGSALLGALALRFLPGAPRRVMSEGRRRPLQSVGIGLAVLLATPVVGVMVGITLIGLPLALALGLAYVLALLLAWPALGLFVGTLIGRRIRPDAAIRPVWGLLLGLVTLHLATHIPILGAWVALFGLSFGLGLLALVLFAPRRSPSSVDLLGTSTPNL